MPNEQTSVPLYAASEILTAANMNISAGTGVPVFATTVTRDAAFGGANEKVLAEGQLCYLSATNVVQYYDGAAWATVGPASSNQVAVFNETQSSGTNGGTFTSGSYVKRTLNTTVVNQITSCTLTSSVISLPAGTYLVYATAPAIEVNNHQTRLRNTTDSTDIQFGSTEFAGATVNIAQTRSEIQTVFTLTATKNIELQHQCQNTRSTYGLGESAAFGNNEIYSQITITKIA